MKAISPFLALLLVLVAITAPHAHAEPVSFRQDIAPILVRRCMACHDAKKAEGGFRVDSFRQVMSAGDSGLASIVANSPGKSEVFRRITSVESGERMPLDADALQAEQVALIKRWIEQGAAYDAPDPEAPLTAILPPPVHPTAPRAYPRTLPITALAFSPDGRQLIAGGYHELTVWSLPDGKLIRRIGNVGQRTYALAVSPNGETLAVGCGNPGQLGEVRLFQLADGDLPSVLVSTSDVVFDVAFNPAGDRLAVAAADGVVRIFDVAMVVGELQFTITSHSDWVMGVAWSHDGAKLATASRDKTAKVFDATTGNLIVTYSGHGEPVQAVAFHPDGKQVYSGGLDNKIQRWRIADGKKSNDVARVGGELYTLATGDGFLFAPSADKSVRQFDLNTGNQLRQYSSHDDSVLSVAFHSGTTQLATGSIDGKVRIWNVADGKPVTTILAAPGYQADSSLSEKGADPLEGTQ